ncbi:MAG: hypothetical protein ISS16_07305 [Ignavibacteria bacterium]|nr:hypothetical protein [Ignavibacteria bacterium]
MAKEKKADKKTKKTVKPPKSQYKNTESDFDNNEFNDDELDDYVDDEYDNFEVEDDREFLKEVKKFEKQHEGSRIVNVYKLIGKPSFKKFTELDKDTLKTEYQKFLTLLDTLNIIVHFKNDYPLKEKYRFITEEIFYQDAEDVKGTNLHVNFIYEDFHPEMDEDEDEEF